MCWKQIATYIYLLTQFYFFYYFKTHVTCREQIHDQIPAVLFEVNVPVV